MQLPRHDTSPNNPTMLPGDRRRSTRHTVTGRVTSVLAATDRQAPNHQITSLQLKDMSDDGVGAITDEPLETGTRLALFFPPHGNAPGFDLYGTVVRCQSRGAMREVGIELDQAATAACA